MKASYILGKNARSMNFSYQYNPAKSRSITVSKIRTKRYLKKAGVPVPDIYKKFKTPEQVMKFDFSSLPSSFALKPARGFGGEGIIVAKKRTKDGEGWITTKRTRVNPDDLRLHILDILEGAYSIRNTPDMAFFEEYVGRHKAFRKYAYRGTPDVRVVVFNKVPVMAMLRLPTRESGGRSNLHQGAIAVGVDIATGITTRAFWHNKYIKYKPGTNKKLHGIKIPQWTKILEVAVESSIATGLGYVGVDVTLHPEKGPMIWELNYMPGLQIQYANKAGLRKRLERVEDLEVRDAEHGVKIAKALFASRFADRVKAKEGIKTVNVFEPIKIRTRKGKKRVEVLAKIDTGAWRTSISQNLAEELGLLEESNVLWTKTVRSSLGKEERPVISLTFYLAGRKITTPASVAKRMALKYPIIIGRKNLKGILVNPEVTAAEKRELNEKVK